jgi:hypothetical protein
VKIYVDWEHMGDDYQGITVEPHRSAIELMKLEAERQSGVTLQDCFNMFTKAEEIDDF